MPYSRPWTTNPCRCVPVEPNAICDTACKPAIVVTAGSSSRRQISGLTPCTTTRSWYTLGRGAGCMVSGMAPILALRTDGPGQGASHGLSRSRSVRLSSVRLGSVEGAQFSWVPVAFRQKFHSRRRASGSSFCQGR